MIDEDLGRTASGAVERPGFERLVEDLCTGHVGAVLCLEASRLSRNGPDWHRLLELCGEVDARVIDLDGVYDPGLPNDRLPLGMKGSISEFELGVLRARMYEAARAKAEIVGGRVRKSYGHGKPASEWAVVLEEHHEGYVGWSEHERNQELLAANAYGALEALAPMTIEAALEAERMQLENEGKRRQMIERMGMQTGQGKTWTARRVQSLRTVHKISGYRSSDKNGE